MTKFTSKMALIQVILIAIAITMGILAWIPGTAGVFWTLEIVALAFVTIMAVAQIVFGILEKKAWWIIAGVAAILAWILMAPGIAGFIVGIIFAVAALIVNVLIAFDGKFMKLPTIKM